MITSIVSSLQQELKKNFIEALLLFNSSRKDPNVLYATNLDYEYVLVFITPTTVQVCVSPMEYHRALSESSATVKKLMGNPLKHLAELCKQHHVKTLAFNASFCSLNEFKYFKKELRNNNVTILWKDFSKQFRALRQIKTPDEIVSLRKACSITDTIFSQVLKQFHTFKTEMEVADYIHTFVRHHGLVESFDTIVASGHHASLPHYRTAAKPLTKGFCVIDFGVRYKNYCSDMTRTIYLGTPSNKEIELYHHVWKAQTSTIELLAKERERRCTKLYHHTTQQLGGLKKYFIHGLGHGVGIEIHEGPSLSPKSKERLKENMVITIEPGIYLPNKAGIRIEDTILITRKGYEMLTRSAKELICLKGKSFV